MSKTLVGRAVVCDVHDHLFGTYVQVSFTGPGMETAPMPWLSVGKRPFAVGDVIVAASEDSAMADGVKRIVHYKEIDGQLEKLAPCRICKLNPLGLVT